MISRQKTLLAATMLMIGLHCSPSWALFEDDEARVAINKMRVELNQLQERLQRMESASGGQFALAQSLSEKDREIARLRGELEVAQNSIRKLQDDYKALYASLDERISKVEPRPLELDGTTIIVPPDQYNDYQAALDHFREANFVEASNGFESFLKSYPESKLQPQVKYFLGSCQFAKGDYKEALITQQKLAKDHPESPRAPDALLSVASSQLELKAVNNAKKTLKELIAQYPESPAADSARQRLDALK